MNCPECGTTIPDPPSRCPSCQRPVVGEPRRTPAGSDAPSGEPRRPARTNALFWSFLVLASLAALLAMFFL